MKKQFKDMQVGCVAYATEILGEKWTPQIIRNLCTGKLRFSQILQKTEGINPRTLSARLDSLEHCQILSRTIYPEVPPRVEYELTDKGKDLIPILQSMAAWGKKYE